VKVSSNVTGDLLSLSVKEGDHVVRGQVLGQIDKRLYETQVTQYRGTVASARAQIAQSTSHRAGQAGPRTGEEAGGRAAGEHVDLDKATTRSRWRGRLASQKELVAQSIGQLDTALYNLSAPR